MTDRTGMTITGADEQIEAIAARQMQRFTRAQVRSLCDGGARILGSRVRSGRWHRLTPRVLCLPGAPTGWLADVWTAHLHVGADTVVSHRSAARIHSLPEVEEGSPCLILPAHGNRRYGEGQLFRGGDLPPGQVVRIGLLPTTSVARTIVDLAPGASRSRLEAWLDHATAQRLVTPDEMLRVVQARSARSRPSMRALEDVLAGYLPDDGVQQGHLEGALDHVLRLAGLPRGIAQFGPPGVDSPAEFCDRAWLQPRLIVECDGRHRHDRIRTARADERRDAAAAAEGWQTVRYGWEQLVEHPQQCARQLRAVHEQRLVSQIGYLDAADDLPSRARQPQPNDWSSVSGPGGVQVHVTD